MRHAKRNKPRAARHAPRPSGRADPLAALGRLRAGVAILLAGCLLSLYVVGLLLIPLGAWLTRREALRA